VNRIFSLSFRSASGGEGIYGMLTSLSSPAFTLLRQVYLPKAWQVLNEKGIFFYLFFFPLMKKEPKKSSPTILVHPLRP
jgi:hypothetical protein